ncbi:hypothetical protein JCM10207_006756 [Rhodosporidiobolus poonsookiae]
MPALPPTTVTALLRRQASSTSDLANTAATRFLPSATNSSNSGEDDGDTKAALWKYAIVVIIAVLGLFLLVRLTFIYRLRKQREALWRAHEQARINRQRGRPGAAGFGPSWSRNNSTETLEWDGHGSGGAVYGRGASAGRGAGSTDEPPPPAYEDALNPPPPLGAPSSSSAPTPPTQPTSRPSFLSRLLSRSSHTSDPSISMRTLSPPATASPSSAPPTRSRDTNTNRTSRRASVEAETIRRALADAGLLVAPPSLALRSPTSSSSGGGLSPSPLAGLGLDALDPDAAARRRREREERRERRRQRRRERREREEEGFGLPTYSKKTTEGEETLQRGEGWKTDESEDDGASDASDEEDARARAQERAQVLTLRATDHGGAPRDGTLPRVEEEERRV